MKPIRAYHFCAKDDKGRAVRLDGKIVKRNEREKYTGPLVLCFSGLHASVHPFDALLYAPGPILRVVECGGEIVMGDDKLICMERKEISRIDADVLLREFACVCAKRALMRERKAGREPDPRSWAAIEVAMRYARGAATLQELAAAGDAAGDAAREAAREAAGAAAWAAARAAAGDAARAAAEAAAWAVAGDVAGDAARAAETKWQRREFSKIVRAAFSEVGK